MATTITAGNATNGAAVSSDNTGILELKTGTGAGTTAISIATNQIVTGTAGNLMLVSKTAITTLSATPQTAPAFTDIPSWAKKVTVMFQAIRTSSTGAPLIQLGTGSTPTYTTSGYVSTATRLQDSAAVSVGSSTSGFLIQSGNSTNQLNGSLILTNLTGNTWVAQGNFSNTTTTNFVFVTAGSIALGATLTAVRLFIDGTQTFNNGSVNILYE
jgi:hypothetical protein